MSKRNTFEQTQEYAREKGVFEQMSDFDWQIARSDPAAAMRIIDYKQQYGASSDPEERRRLNQAANRERMRFGASGGTWGNGYYEVPGFYARREEPDAYGEAVNRLFAERQAAGGFSYDSAPRYRSRYGAEADELAGQIRSYRDFEYDPEQDPLYSAYRKQAAREGERSVRDTLASYAAMTGGRPSTAAVSAATQAGNYYSAQLADRLPELYKLAYGRYKDDYERLRSALGAMQSMEKSDYARYLDELKQYNSDRDLAYKGWREDYGRLTDSLDTAQALRDAERKDYWERERFDRQSYIDGSASAQKHLARLLDEWKQSDSASDEIAGLFGVVRGAPYPYREPEAEEYAAPSAAAKGRR